MIGAGGAEKIIEMSLTPPQKRNFANSVASVQEMVDTLYKLKFFDN
jgi:malate dehydrogenase